MDNQQRIEPERQGRREQRHEARTNQTFMEFVRELCQQGKFSEEEAVKAASSVLCHLQARLTPEEGEDFRAQLPLKMQEILTECRLPEGEHVHKLHRTEFIRCVADELGRNEDDAERIVRSVFFVARSRISEGEASDVAAQLPSDLKPLWTQPA